jgi:hypothetical protein
MGHDSAEDTWIVVRAVRTLFLRVVPTKDRNGMDDFGQIDSYAKRLAKTRARDVAYDNTCKWLYLAAFFFGVGLVCAGLTIGLADTVGGKVVGGVVATLFLSASVAALVAQRRKYRAEVEREEGARMQYLTNAGLPV